MNQPKLRRALLANAAFCALCAVDSAVFAKPLAVLFGGADVRIFYGLAVGLLLYVGQLTWALSRPSLGRGPALYFVLADGLWVLGSLLLLCTGWVSGPLAVALVAGVALVVAYFAGAQWRAVRP